MAPRGPFKFGTDPWDPTHRFETSWLLSPWALFFCRALLCLYCFTTLLFVLAWQCVHSDEGCSASRDTFSYFTHLSYWGLAFYLLFASAHTFTYARSAGGAALLDRFPRPLQALHALLYSTVAVFPIIVTVVYWAVLYSGGWFPAVFSGWSNMSQHALNSVFAAFEILVPRTDPMPPVHMLWLILLLALYLALAYVTEATKGFYTYSFLDPAEQGGLVAAYVFGIAVGCLVVFGLVWLVIWLRKFITERKLGMTGKFSSRAGQAAAGKDLEMSSKPQEANVA
ncbi:hypothetical protein VTK26DRAFT_4336 [Humicola hyalothermophila]